MAAAAQDGCCATSGSSSDSVVSDGGAAPAGLAVAAGAEGAGFGAAAACGAAPPGVALPGAAAGSGTAAAPGAALAAWRRRWRRASARLDDPADGALAGPLPMRAATACHSRLTRAHRRPSSSLRSPAITVMVTGPRRLERLSKQPRPPVATGRKERAGDWGRRRAAEFVFPRRPAVAACGMQQPLEWGPLTSLPPVYHLTIPLYNCGMDMWACRGCGACNPRAVRHLPPDAAGQASAVPRTRCSKRQCEQKNGGRAGVATDIG